MPVMMHIYEIIIIFLLVLECWMIWFWSKEHATILSIISHKITMIRKKSK